MQGSLPFLTIKLHRWYKKELLLFKTIYMDTILTEYYTIVDKNEEFNLHMKTRSSGWRLRGRGEGSVAVAAIVVAVVLEELNKRLLLCRLEAGSDYYKNITLNLRDNTIRTPNAVIYGVFSLLLPISTLTRALIQLSQVLLLLNSKTLH